MNRIIEVLRVIRSALAHAVKPRSRPCRVIRDIEVIRSALAQAQ